MTNITFRSSREYFKHTEKESKREEKKNNTRIASKSQNQNFMPEHSKKNIKRGKREEREKRGKKKKIPVKNSWNTRTNSNTHKGEQLERERKRGRKSRIELKVWTFLFRQGDILNSQNEKEKKQEEKIGTLERERGWRNTPGEKREREKKKKKREGGKRGGKRTVCSCHKRSD